MAQTTSDLLVERLIEWGVDTVFGLPGDGINGIFDALRKNQDKIRFIQVRHEEAAAFAACGYAKFTGRLGVCMATSGPGGIHLLNGLYDATMDNQPVLAITGHTFHDLIGTHTQQDVAMDKLMDNVAVLSERVSGPAHVQNLVDQAIRMAMSHRGVAHITVPKDIQTWPASEEHRSKRNIKGHSGVIWQGPRPLPPQADLTQGAEVLNQGKKVVIFAGQGALGARAELEEVAEILGAVIIKPLLGKGVVPDTSPYTTGGVGLLGTKPSQEAISDCDTLLMVGTSFPYEAFYPSPGQARGVQIDLKPERIGLRYPVEVGLPGDSQSVLRALIPLLRRNEDRSFLQKAQDGMKEWWEVLDERASSDHVPMKPQVVAHQLDQLMAHDAIVICDSGTAPTWMARHWRLRGDQMFSISGNLATMACGVPYALGAQIAYPNRQVVAVVGDGAFTMLMGELATYVKYNLPVKIVILKDNYLNQIKWEQLILEGFPEFAVDLQPIDFAKAAEAFGVLGLSMENPKDAPTVLKRALDHPGPVVVEAVVDPLEPPMPPMVTRDQAIHFAKSLAKGQPDRLEIAVTAGKEFVRQIV